MAVTLTEREKKFYDIIIAVVLLLIGFGFFTDWLPPYTIKVEPTETGANVYLHTRSTWLPFKSIDTFIPNVKQALPKEDRVRRGTIEILVLKTDDEQEINILRNQHDLISSYIQELRIQINDSIGNKTPFTKTVRNSDNLIDAILFFLMGIGFLLYVYLKPKKETTPDETSSGDDENN